MANSSEFHFRVIVVGAGVSGLTASHCLRKAGIDHVVLEKRDDVAPPEGASISIYPQMVRVLHQIGCLDPLLKISFPHKLAHIRRPDGRLAGSNDLFQRFQKNHGPDLLPMSRRDFLHVLYEGLPDKSVIRTGLKITELNETSTGVEVMLNDGTVEKGDIVLGCDGVHSVVRRLMWEQMAKIKPSLLSENREDAAFKIEWKCLLGIGPAHPSLGETDLTYVHNPRFTFVLLAQPGCTYFIIPFLLDNPIRPSDKVRYTEADAEALAASIADHPITESLKFSHLWKNRIRGSLVSLEEGVLDRWHHGRIVLAGDVVHKATPNIALGGNTAMEDVVSLTNHLHTMLKKAGGNKPDTAVLDAVFAQYQAERLERAKYVVTMSGLASRIQAEQTLLHKIAGLLIPVLPIGPVASNLGEYIRAGPKLDFVKIVDFASGRMSWKDEGEQARQTAMEEPRKQKKRFWGVIGMTAVLVMLLSATRYMTNRIFGTKAHLD
ncbi:hypothetical protein F4823DRAFT_407066 [Ustulina deusta]|nr:hypothetical protein F4823DRAFT_407066 [Ustulina deusta]